MLDAVRLGQADDATAVTASQLRDVVDRIVKAGQWRAGDPDIVIVCVCRLRRGPAGVRARRPAGAGYSGRPR